MRSYGSTGAMGLSAASHTRTLGRLTQPLLTLQPTLTLTGAVNEQWEDSLKEEKEKKKKSQSFTFKHCCLTAASV